MSTPPPMQLLELFAEFPPSFEGIGIEHLLSLEHRDVQAAAEMRAGRGQHEGPDVQRAHDLRQLLPERRGHGVAPLRTRHFEMRHPGFRCQFKTIVRHFSPPNSRSFTHPTRRRR
jgi:hypothetical protein